ncbi:MAG: TonB-dependent receptor, partial [Bacteroidia bacterium]|nr:TonB-dependent receptor [Bacteroidia bacterium]
MKLNALLMVTFLFSTTLISQNEIRGKTVDESGNPIEAVVVSLFSADKSSFIKAAVTEIDGSFLLNNIPLGIYLLEAQSLGFKIFKLDGLEVEADVSLKDLVMQPETESLGEVTIIAEKPMVQVLADKTVFNIENTINAIGDSGFELLRKAPGVIIDNNDNLIVEGKTGVLIYIDDKPSVLRGEDLINYLKTIQATDIESIEIITQPSSKYDAEGNAGIVNIIFKRDKSLGTNGSVTSGLTYGDYARYNTSVSFNNRNKKTSLYGSFSNRFGASYGFINLYRTQSNTIFDAQTESIYDTNNNNIRLGFDFYANEKSTFGAIVTGNFSNSDSESNSRTPIIPVDSNSPEEVLIASSITDSKTSNLYANVNYKFKAGDDASFNVDVDYGRYDRDRDNLQPNTYFNGDESQMTSENINYMVTPIAIDLFTTKADFEHTFLKGKLGLGVKYSKIVTDNEFDFYDRINGQDVINEERTNQFNYDEQINAAYFNYNKKFKDVNIQFGLRVENTRSDGVLTALQEEQNDRVIRNYTDWFPSGGITYQMNQKNALALTYSKRVQRPNYQSLNPFEYKIDELSFSKGNPFLQPQYTDNLKLSHTYNYRLTTSVSYS